VATVRRSTILKAYGAGLVETMVSVTDGTATYTGDVGHHSCRRSKLFTFAPPELTAQICKPREHESLRGSQG
jgi:hypothetical protein